MNVAIIIILLLILIILTLIYLDYIEPESKFDTSIFKYKVSFCFIVRDGDEYLEKNLTKIAQIGELFEDYRIFYLENDSKDRTIEILKNAKKRNRKIIGRSEKLNNLQSIAMCPIVNINCNKRTMFLANIRQNILNESLEWDSDLTIMLDMDFEDFDRYDFLNMINKMKQKKANGIFGMSYIAYPYLKIPYDMGAIVPIYKLLSIIILSGLVKVDSAFSGFGVYKSDYLRQHKIRYDGSKNIEHIHFNKQIDNLYVDPNFNPTYHFSLLEKISN
jgi:hypothetical protein